MSTPVNVGIIGIGDIGYRHAVLLGENRSFRVAVAADADAKRLDSVKGIAADLTTDWKSVLARKDVEAVFITTPPHLHKEMTLATLAAGKHIFLEKPMTANLEDADAICDAVERSDRVVLVGFQERHNIPFVEIRRAVREGALGDVLMIRATGRIPRKRLEKGWLFNTAQGGGAVLESSIHNWDLARWVTGQEFTRVFAEGIWMQKMGTEYDDTFCAVARLSGGAIMQIETCFSLPDGAAFDSRIEFVGTRGMAYYDNARQPLLINSEVGYRLADRTATGNSVVNLVHVGPDMGAYRREHAHFHDCLRNGAAPAATVEDSRRSLRVALAAIESMRSHQPVSLT